ncbi:nuclear receptor-interacting protein 1 [Triplophysa dalaica]|uniref:nuclear receptor-interacting protein 1 n=1 Tax=Triplophysa dalaica TaxID=1582913 RepID=UPI0024DFA84C|nr:nuclear receptor-interacting protein 1 [Triplophysa dalaica]XP_056613239.1 nuclear receptor-interacting protein 1 [Triplophysa dalaica]
MTHGEEPGPETHQDSAVLTYLEGLLMHQVAGGQGATATQSGNQEQRNKEGRGHAQSNHSTQQEPNRTISHCGASQHLRKARLLNSEAWTDSESLRRSAPPAALNGQNEDRHSGQNGSSQDKGESTLLASLLQSFSSRLQNVTLPQQIIQGLRPQDTSCQISKAPQDHRACHRPASSHLKGLVNKSKVTNHSNSVPYQRRRSSQESFSESPKALKSSTPSPSPESLSCTERLKAVANLVNIRSSPAPSPKPSVACSQLALLLSSEAHLQQYSREHALKAQLSGRLASERLSAMATQQNYDKKQLTTSSQAHGLSLLHTQNGIASQMSTSSSRQSPSLGLGQRRAEGSMRTGHRLRERRPFEKPGRPSQNCSSLLLQLLNSHNTSQRINGQGHLKDDLSTFGTRSSPLFSDSEHSNPDSSFTKDSSDAESIYSSCSPIDLSLKTRTHVQTPVSTSSSPALERVPECSLNRWMPDTLPFKVAMDHREVDACAEMKPHHKVTLLQLLLDHKNNDRVNKGLDNPDMLRSVIPNVTSPSTSSQSVFSTTSCKDTSELNSHCGMNCRSPKLLPTFAQSRDSNSSVSPYTVYGSPHSQSAPLDLCKTKQPSSEIKEPAFSASKLLQNLAHCGKQNPTISPPVQPPLPPIKLMNQELKVNHPITLLERLTAPIQSPQHPLWDEAKAKTSAQHVSEIENLLERRTVLQLLLGNAPQKEKLGSKRKRDHARNNSIDKQTNQALGQYATNGPSLDISIKTEPVEYDQAEEGYFDSNKISKQSQNFVVEPKKSTSYLSPGYIKQEPLSPEATPRDGILCNLLKKRPNRTLPANKVDDLNKGYIKEESLEIQGPTIPKKRKLSKEPEDHSTSQQDGYLERSSRIKDNSNFSVAGDREASDPSSLPEAESPPARFPPRESTENRGFNVLKQLLLSDNCLKELSQPRGTFSSPSHNVLNGNTFEQPCSEGELQNFHRSLSPSNVIFKRASNHMPESPPVTLQEKSGSKIEYASINDLKVPAKMVNGDGQTQKYNAEMPRFTKTNPILYYMLQRSNAHLVKEGKELDADTRQIQTKVKNGSLGDTGAFEL